MAHRVQLTVAAAMFVAACGLDVVGVAPADGGVLAQPDGAAPVGDDGSPPPTAPDANVCNTTCAAATAKDPTFTNVVLFGDATATCPAGFGSAEVVENPVANASACGCGACTVTASCNGDPAVHNSNSPGCGNPDGTFNANNGACVKLSNTVWGHDYEQFTAAAPVGVQGAATATANPSGVDTAKKRMCMLTGCSGAACAAPTGFRACVEADGDHACPSGFSERHSVGDDISLTCGACTIANATATCTGTLNWWSNNSSCAGTPKAIPENTCGEVDGADLGSYQWVGAIATQSCTATPGTPNVALKGVKTICCP